MPVAPQASPSSPNRQVLITPPVGPPPPGMTLPLRPSGPPPAVPASAPGSQGPIPASGAIEALSHSQSAQLAAMAAQIVGLDYFEVLKLGAAANPGEIKKAFYRESRVFHPDRFFHLADDATKADLGTIYKRITEAYYFLKDDQKRRKYVADISGPDRNNRLRFTETSEAETKAEVKKAAEEEIGTHPKGRAFFTTALKEIASENWAAAQRSLKTAMTYEPGNARYKAELLKVDDKLAAAWKAKGDQFKIK